MRVGRAAFVFIFITVALDMLALGIMIPVLPKLIVEFRNGDIAAGARVSGLFGFAWAGMQFFFSPLLGTLSDRFGRRPVILLSNLGLGLDYVLMAVAPSLGWLFLGRIVSGITSASYPTACAYTADVTSPEKRAGRFGLLSAAFGLGFVVGPSLGGFLGGFDLRLPFWVAAVLSLVNTLYGYFILPESHPPEHRTKCINWGSLHPFAALKFLGALPGVKGLALVATLFYLAHESLPSVFVLYADYRYAWGESAVGLALAVVGISQTLVSALLVGPAVKRLGDWGGLLVGQVFAIAGFAIYGLASTGSLFLVGVPVLAVWGLIGPAYQSLVSNRVPDQAQGQLQGALGSLRGIMGMVGPILFTQVFAASISPEAGILVPGSPYYLSALLMAASFFLVLKIRALERKFSNLATVPE